MITIRLRKFSSLISTTLVLATAAGCFFEVDDGKKKDGAPPPPPSTSSGHIDWGGSESRECSVSSYKWTTIGSQTNSETHIQCAEQGAEAQLHECDGSECKNVKVNVHYMLSKNLGPDRVVIVEAFSNPNFAGAPESTSILTGFDSSRPGTRGQLNLALANGKYYFRAYITNSQESASPYEYGGMHLVADRPVGTYGAASNAVHVEVSGSSRDVATLDIYIDKLFARNGAEPDTRAHMRFKLDLAPEVTVEAGKRVKIQLFEQEDFAFDPKYSYDLASENFLITGRERKAEFLTPSLELGRFYIRIFYDNSNNNFFDDDEPEVTFMSGGVKGIIETKEGRTDLVNLTLRLPVAD